MAGIMAVNGASEVHCFEPNPDNASQIQCVVDLNPEHSYFVHQIAASDADGTAQFTIMSESSMGQLETSEFHGDATAENSFEVHTRRLDTLIAENQIRYPSHEDRCGGRRGGCAGRRMRDDNETQASLVH